MAALFKQFPPGLRAFAATQLEDPMIVMLGLTQPGRMVSSADGAQLGLLDYLAMQPWPGYETSIEVSLICESLFMISELEFTFEVGFQLMLSWTDASIFRQCDGKDPWAEDPLECPEQWRPEIEFLNAKEVELIEGSATLYGLPRSWDAAYGGAGTGQAMAFLMARYRGVFTAPMGFRDFPADTQRLPIKLFLKSWRDEVNTGGEVKRFQTTILPRATLGPDILSRRDDPTSLTDTLSGWDIASANAQEFVHLIMDHDALSGGGGAFDEYLRVVGTFGINMEEYQKVSAAEYTVVVERKASYFFLNFVLSELHKCCCGPGCAFAKQCRCGQSWFC